MLVPTTLYKTRFTDFSLPPRVATRISSFMKARHTSSHVSDPTANSRTNPKGERKTALIVLWGGQEGSRPAPPACSYMCPYNTKPRLDFASGWTAPYEGPPRHAGILELRGRSGSVLEPSKRQTREEGAFRRERVNMEDWDPSAVRAFIRGRLSAYLVSEPDINANTLKHWRFTNGTALLGLTVEQLQQRSIDESLELAQLLFNDVHSTRGASEAKQHNTQHPSSPSSLSSSSLAQLQQLQDRDAHIERLTLELAALRHAHVPDSSDITLASLSLAVTDSPAALRTRTHTHAARGNSAGGARLDLALMWANPLVTTDPSGRVVELDDKVDWLANTRVFHKSVRHESSKSDRDLRMAIEPLSQSSLFQVLLETPKVLILNCHGETADLVNTQTATTKKRQKFYLSFETDEGEVQ
jgi:hypothetical protein